MDVDNSGKVSVLLLTEGFSGAFTDSAAVQAVASSSDRSYCLVQYLRKLVNASSISLNYLFLLWITPIKHSLERSYTYLRARLSEMMCK